MCLIIYILTFNINIYGVLGLIVRALLCVAIPIFIQNIIFYKKMEFIEAKKILIRLLKRMG